MEDGAVPPPEIIEVGPVVFESPDPNYIVFLIWDL